MFRLRCLTLLLLGCFAPPAMSGLIAEAGGARAAEPGTVLVAGASGRTGRLIVGKLLEQGYRVRPLTTSVQGARTRTGLDVDWLEVDVRDARAVAAAMQDVDYVICAVGAREWRGPNSPRHVDYGGVANLVDAARQSSVRHFVLISSAAAGPHRDHRENPRRGYVLYWKTRGEAHLRASGLDYTVIGPGGLEDGPSGPERGIRLTAREDYRRGPISRGDVAEVAVAVLSMPAARNRSFAIVNDADIAPERWPQQLKALAPDPVRLHAEER